MSDLPPTSADSLAQARRLDTLCDEFEAGWLQGAHPRVEEFLTRIDAALQTQLATELVPLEIHHRRRRGEPVTATEYSQRFPHLPPAVIERALATPNANAAHASSQRISLAETLAHTKPVTPRSADELPEQFGRYRIIKALGKGAMGVVYLARDTQLARDVALKVPQLTGPDQAELIARFYREARAAAVLRHPHICPVFDVGQIDGRHFITMSYVEGHPLTKYISATKPPKPKVVANLVRKIALGLSEAHQHGIIHRDLKPGNIMVDVKGEPTVMDFGLARNFRSQEADHVTQTGMLVGTPAYMSPEQIAGDPKHNGPAGDVWSLGVILYELLSGRLPFSGGTIWAVIGAIQNETPRPLPEVRPDVPPELARICHKMMTKDVAGRYAEMTAVANALTKFIKDSEAPSFSSLPKALPLESPPPPPKAVPAVQQTQPAIQRAAAPAARGDDLWQSLRSQHPLALVGAAVAASIIVLIGAIWMQGGDSTRPPQDPPTPAAPQVSERPAAIPPPLPEPAPVDALDPERVLFYGRDLRGWKQQTYANTKDANLINWSVDSQTGIIRSNGLDNIDLISNDRFRDFELSCDWRAQPGWETKLQFTPGILVRGEGVFGTSPRGVEIDFNGPGNGKPYGTGGFLAFDTKLTNHEGSGKKVASHLAFGRLVEPKLEPFPAWNRIRIQCRADRVQVWINQLLVNEGWDVPHRYGYVALRDQQSPCEIRNLVIRDIGMADAVLRSEATPKPEAMPEGGPILGPLRELRGHVGAVNSVCITADGRVGFTTGGWPNGDQTVRKWNLEAGSEVAVYRKHTGLVDAIACDPDGGRVVTAGKDKDVHLIDGKTMETIQTLPGHRKGVNSIAMSPDGQWAASASDDHTIRLWNLARREPAGILTAAAAPGTRTAISADSRLVAAGSFDTELILGELETGRVVRRWCSPPSTCHLQFLADGTRLFSAHLNGVIAVWETESGKLLQRWQTEQGLTAARVLPGETHVLVAENKGKLVCLELSSGKVLSSQSLGGHVYQVVGANNHILYGGMQSGPDSQTLHLGEFKSPEEPSAAVSWEIPPLAADADENEVARHLYRLGGRLQIAGESQPTRSFRQLPKSWKCTWLSLSGCPLRPREVQLIAKLGTVPKIELNRTNVGDDDLLSIQTLLRTVMDLKLSHSQVTDATMNWLASNRGLGQLDVDFTQVTAAALRNVVRSNSLKLMAVDTRQFSAEVRAELKLKPPVQFFVLMEHPSAKLETGHLQNVTMNALQLFGNYHESQPTCGADLSPLRQAANLKNLRLVNYKLDDSHISQLSRLSQVKSMTFQRCSLPENALTELRRALSDCKVEAN